MHGHEEPGIPEKQRDLHISLMGLMREMILEGVVDPNKGTQFTLMQSEPTQPFAELEQIAERASLIVTVGIPNPLKNEFDELVLDEETLKARDEEAIEGLRRLSNELGEEGE